MSPETRRYNPFHLPFEMSSKLPKRLSACDPFVLALVYASPISRIYGDSQKMRLNSLSPFIRRTPEIGISVPAFKVESEKCT